MSGTSAPRDLDWIAAREEERARLRKELHDGFSQKASAALLALDMLQMRAVKADFDPSGIADELARVSAAFRSAVEDIQSIAFRLSDDVLTTAGLAPALQVLVEETQRRSRIPCAFTCDGAGVVPADTGIRLYRATQEILHWMSDRLIPKAIRIALQAVPPQVTLVANGCGNALDDALFTRIRQSVAALGAVAGRHPAAAGEARVTVGLAL